MFGIENLKKVLALVIEMGNVGDQIGQGTTKEWKKWFALVDLIDEIGGLFTVQWNQLGNEYKDLDQNERSEIRLFLKEKFDIKDDKLENVIEDSFLLLEETEKLIKKYVDLVKQLR